MRRLSQEPAEFAGHYKVATWACGSTCQTGAIIDLRSGRVYWDNRLFCPSMPKEAAKFPKALYAVGFGA